MQMVIDIPKYVYEDIKEVYEHNHTVEATYSYIYHGTPLPKGHGRLIDAEVFTNNVVKYSHQSTKTIGQALADAPTIIEADKAGEGE